MSKEVLIRAVIATDMPFEMEGAPKDRFELNDAPCDGSEAPEPPDHGSFAEAVGSVELPGPVWSACGQPGLLLPRMRRPSSIMSASAMETP